MVGSRLCFSIKVYGKKSLESGTAAEKVPSEISINFLSGETPNIKP